MHYLRKLLETFALATSLCLALTGCAARRGSHLGAPHSTSPPFMTAPRPIPPPARPLQPKGAEEKGPASADPDSLKPIGSEAAASWWHGAGALARHQVSAPKANQGWSQSNSAGEAANRGAEYALALHYWRAGNVAACKHVLARLLRAQPGHRRGTLLFAEVQLLEQQPAQALPAVRELCRRDPRDAEARHALSVLLQACGRDEQATPSLRQQVTESAPDEVAISESLVRARHSGEDLYGEEVPAEYVPVDHRAAPTATSGDPPRASSRRNETVKQDELPVVRASTAAAAVRRAPEVASQHAVPAPQLAASPSGQAAPSSSAASASSPMSQPAPGPCAQPMPKKIIMSTTPSATESKPQPKVVSFAAFYDSAGSEEQYKTAGEQRSNAASAAAGADKPVPWSAQAPLKASFGAPGKLPLLPLSHTVAELPAPAISEPAVSQPAPAQTQTAVRESAPGAKDASAELPQDANVPIMRLKLGSKPPAEPAEIMEAAKPARTSGLVLRERAHSERDDGDEVREGVAARSPSEVVRTGGERVDDALPAIQRTSLEQASQEPKRFDAQPGDHAALATQRLKEAEARLAAGDIEVAANLLLSAVEVAPADSKYPLAAGVLALRGNQPELALAVLEPAAEQFADSARVWRTLGAAYYRLGDYAAAEDALAAALHLENTSPHAWYLMGATLEKLGREREAARHFRQAYKLDPALQRRSPP